MSKFPPRVTQEVQWIGVNAKGSVFVDYISIQEHQHILSEERARLWKAIELAIQDGAKFIGGAAGAAFSETSPSCYIEKALAQTSGRKDEL